MTHVGTSLPDLAQRLTRSEEFEQALCVCFDRPEPLPSSPVGRTELCFAALLLSREHAAVLREALAIDAPSTATALFRLQFEALLRAAWIRFAATEEHIAKLSPAISEEAEQAAKNLPGQQDMISAVKRSAPAGLAQPLAELHENIRNVLHSYVHTGLHPIRRRLAGFPTDLVFVLLTHSNRLMHHAYRVMALLHNSQALMNEVTSVSLRFNDCVDYQDDAGTGSHSVA